VVLDGAKVASGIVLTVNGATRSST
jgi:hypothetical protein